MYIATILLGWIVNILPEDREGLIWLQHISSLSLRFRTGKEVNIHYPAVPLARSEKLWDEYTVEKK
jgi:hypothetical protein